MNKDELEAWVTSRIGEVEARIISLPWDPTPEALAQYKQAQEELIKLGAIRRKFSRHRPSTTDEEEPLY